MGCELCNNNTKSENIDITLTRKDNNKPIIKQIINKHDSVASIYRSSILTDTTRTNRTSIEEKLNTKYSIPFKSEMTSLDLKRNTSSVSNSLYNTRNKLIKEKENEVLSSILKEKGEFSALELNYNFSGITNENSNKFYTESISNLPEITSFYKKREEDEDVDIDIDDEDEDEEGENDEEEEDEEEEDEEQEDLKIYNDEDNNKNLELDKTSKNIESLLKQIDYQKIDSIINESPEKEKTSLSQLIKYFQKKSKNLSEIEKAYLIYKWITLNIEYDFAGVNDLNYDVSAETTFNRGKSISEGYSNLFKKISSELNLIVVKISGHSKGLDFQLTDKFEVNKNHTWNAIQINKVWYFIETMWGAGYMKDHKNFIKHFTSYYFLTPPIQFIRGHFPKEAKWQLLPKKEIIDQKKYMEFVDLKSTFFELGFESIDPDFCFNQVNNEKGSVKIYFDENNVNIDKIKIMANLELIRNKTNLIEIENSAIVIKNKNFFEINYVINNKGKYILKIFGAKFEEEQYHELCSLILISKKDSPLNISYPKTYNLYDSSDIEIISPKNGVLYNGDTIDFEYKTNTYKNLYIIISDNENNNFISMERQGNIFKENYILIYGQKVKISTKNPKSESYYTILEYTVQKNPNNNYSVIFPKTYRGPKNRLINPLCSTLKKGQKVSFAIKSFSIIKMVVLDGNRKYRLKRKNNIFSGNVIIKSNKKNSSVKIGYSEDGKTFGVLYEYDVVT